MNERIIHPIEYQMIANPKTVIDLLNEHYDYDTNRTAEVPDARIFSYVEHIAAIVLGNRSLPSIAMTARAYNFAAAIGAMVGYDNRIIKASEELGSSTSFDELQAIVTERTDTYIHNNTPAMRLVETYSDVIAHYDDPADIFAVRAVTATIMRHIQQGNEAHTIAREIASLESLLASASTDQPD